MLILTANLASNCDLGTLEPAIFRAIIDDLNCGRTTNRKFIEKVAAQTGIPVSELKVMVKRRSIPYNDDILKDLTCHETIHAVRRRS